MKSRRQQRGGRGHPLRRPDPKWTTHRVPVRLGIKEILEYKQTANKPPTGYSACFLPVFPLS